MRLQKRCLELPAEALLHHQQDCSAVATHQLLCKFFILCVSNLKLMLVMLYLPIVWHHEGIVNADSHTIPTLR